MSVIGCFPPSPPTLNLVSDSVSKTRLAKSKQKFAEDNNLILMKMISL